MEPSMWSLQGNLSEKDEQVVRLRIFNVLKHWVDKHWMDFSEDSSNNKSSSGLLLQNLKEFAEGASQTMKNPSEQLLKAITSQVGEYLHLE